MLIERFGKFHKILKPGIHFIIPVVDQPRTIHWRYLVIKPGQSQPTLTTVNLDRVDTREHVLDFAKQTVITRDTVAISINALAYFVIRDPRLAVYKIQNLPYAIELLVQSTLRNLVAKITLDDAFSSREQINAELLQTVSKDAQRWGVSIMRVEVVNIEPPPDIKSAMESQITAERARRSAVLQADGLRESTIVSSRGKCAEVILNAEGARTQQVQLAKGDAESKLMLARAEAECISILRAALDKLGFAKRRAVDYMVSVQWLRNMERMSHASEGHTVLVPRNIFDSLRAAGKLS
jgi:regulator of protease activity HflC (stomatin/prohibitin superfamily)